MKKNKNEPIKEDPLLGYDVTIDDWSWAEYKVIGKDRFNTGVRQVASILIARGMLALPIPTPLNPPKIARGMVAQDGVSNLRKKRVYLQADEADYFRLVGDGKLSLGLRVALAAYLKNLR